MSLNGPAAARLYDEHADAIYAYIARRLGAVAGVVVVGEVFEHALRTQRNESSDTERGWLLAIATALLRRYGADEAKRLRNWSSEAERSGAPPVVNDPLLAGHAGQVAGATTDAVMAAVADLEPVDRDVLLLVAWEHYPPRVVGEAVGLSPRDIRSRLGSIRKELKRRLATARPELDAGVAE